MSRLLNILNDALELTNIPADESGSVLSVHEAITEMVDNDLISEDEGLEALVTLKEWVRAIGPANLERYVTAHFLTIKFVEEQEAASKPQSKKPILTLVSNSDKQLAGE